MKKVLALVNSICSTCKDEREFCPHSQGKHGTGDWRTGDALITLGEALGMPPYRGRHSRGRHGA